MDRASFRILVPVVAVTLSGCASVSQRVESYSAPVPSKGLVLVLDGAGGFPEASNQVMYAVDRMKMPVSVRRFEWSHGMGRGVADMTDTNHSQAEARHLAADINWYRANYPGLPITVVGYSAGAYVALESTKYMPPGTIDNLVLLAPAVAANYDLRPALVASRQGIDSFHSEQDTFYLGAGTFLIGTADGKNGVPPAGRVGFDPPADGCDASKVRQHPWNPSVTWSGNYGSHAGTIQPAYLRAYVLPLFLPPPTSAATIPGP